MLEKIVSGGQTGVDRAALDFAIANEIPHGGYCPKGRLAEDGPISETYQLTELDSTDYRVRTEKNVVTTDGTLIFYRKRLYGGTGLTNTFAKNHDKPVFRFNFDGKKNASEIVEWILVNKIKVLNVAGPRESSSPGIDDQVHDALKSVLNGLRSTLFE